MDQAQVTLDNYTALAVATESRIAKIEGVGPLTLHATLDTAILMSEVLDKFKKFIFYGRAFDQNEMAAQFANIASTAEFLSQFVAAGQWQNPNDVQEVQLPDEIAERLKNLTVDVDPRIFHGIVGAFTESGELLQPLQHALEGKPFDKPNLVEEVGDANWYLNGVLADALGVPVGQVLATNIKKLQDKQKGRYKGGTFNAEAAQQENRDLTAERSVLEAGSKSA